MLFMETLCIIPRYAEKMQLHVRKLCLSKSAHQSMDMVDLILCKMKVIYKNLVYHGYATSLLWL